MDEVVRKECEIKVVSPQDLHLQDTLHLST